MLLKKTLSQARVKGWLWEEATRQRQVMGILSVVEMLKQASDSSTQRQQQRDMQLMIVGKARRQRRNSSSKLCSRQQQ